MTTPAGLRGTTTALVTLVAVLLAPQATVSAAPDVGDGSPSAGVTDHLVLGDDASEHAHRLTDTGASRAERGTAEAGQIREDYTARRVTEGGEFTARLRIAPDQPLSVQFSELRPNGMWGATYGFRILIDGVLVYVRDPATQDPGGGPYSSFFVETSDPDIVGKGHVTVTVIGTSPEPAYFTDVRAYGDLTGMVEEQGMRVPNRMVAMLGKDYHSQDQLRAEAAYVTSHVRRSADVPLGGSVLDYFTARTPQQMAANYQRYLRLSREYDLPVAIESTSDWEGTPSRVPDGHGGTFGDIEYQQILWSPQDQTHDEWRGQRLSDFMGDKYDVRYGLSVPNVWGSTPWLTWNHPRLNAYYERKADESLDQVRPLLWQLQRTGEADRILPFSTTTESTYWGKQDGEGVWDIVYTDHNGGVERTDIIAGFNPSTIAAAAADGVTLEPTDGLSEDEKWWLYQNQSEPQQLFADAFYDGLPRPRIDATARGLEFPEDSLRHNIFSEVYSRKQEPYWSGVYPSVTQGFVHRARPGSEYIELDNYSPGGFGHLQKAREFGRIANPNLEVSVSPDPADKLLLLRQQHVMGSRYTTIYNWREGEIEKWVNPFVDDMHPWDVVHDPAPTGLLQGRARVIQEFTAGAVRLLNRIDVRLARTGDPAALRLVVREGGAGGRVVGMRHLGAAEVPASGWASFRLPVVELTKGERYTVEIEQVGGDEPGYAFPQADGDLLFRTGLDMVHERDRSLVIQWRRDAADAITNVAGDASGADGHARRWLNQARAALDHDRLVDAYRFAMRADSLRFPVLYQVSGEAVLDPFPVTIGSEADADVNVTSYREGADGSLTFTVSSYEAGTVRVTVGDPLTGAEVRVDGEPVQPGPDGAVTFTADAGKQHTVDVRDGSHGES